MRWIVPVILHKRVSPFLPDIVAGVASLGARRVEVRETHLDHGFRGIIRPDASVALYKDSGIQALGAALKIIQCERVTTAIKAFPVGRVRPRDVLLFPAWQNISFPFHVFNTTYIKYIIKESFVPQLINFVNGEIPNLGVIRVIKPGPIGVRGGD